MKRHFVQNIGADNCPLCGSNSNVKGFKVCGKDNVWWSYCYADHRTSNSPFPNNPELLTTGKTREDCLWFGWYKNDTECHIQVAGHNITLKVGYEKV